MQEKFGISDGSTVTIRNRNGEIVKVITSDEVVGNTQNTDIRPSEPTCAGDGIAQCDNQSGTGKTA